MPASAVFRGSRALVHFLGSRFNAVDNISPQKLIWRVHPSFIEVDNKLLHLSNVWGVGCFPDTMLLSSISFLYSISSLFEIWHYAVVPSAKLKMELEQNLAVNSWLHLWEYGKGLRTHPWWGLLWRIFCHHPHGTVTQRSCRLLGQGGPKWVCFRIRCWRQGYCHQ